MVELFSDFYDKFDYIEKDKETETDRFGNIIYSEPTQVDGRFISSSRVFIQDGESTKSVIERLYHVPRDLEIQVGDKLDGYEVEKIGMSTGIEGTVYFKKVWCI